MRLPPRRSHERRTEALAGRAEEIGRHLGGPARSAVGACRTAASRNCSPRARGRSCTSPPAAFTGPTTRARPGSSSTCRARPTIPARSRADGRPHLRLRPRRRRRRLRQGRSVDRHGLVPPGPPRHRDRRIARVLPPEELDCERIPLGEPDDYKPCIARLPDGELLLTAFHQHKRDGNKVLEQTLLFRSKDGGRTWSKPEKLDLLGREPYLTVLKDGTVFITGHLLANDVRNKWGYTHGFLHRSTDARQDVGVDPHRVGRRSSRRRRNHTDAKRAATGRRDAAARRRLRRRRRAVFRLAIDRRRQDVGQDAEVRAAGLQEHVRLLRRRDVAVAGTLAARSGRWSASTATNCRSRAARSRRATTKPTTSSCSRRPTAERRSTASATSATTARCTCRSCGCRTGGCC